MSMLEALKSMKRQIIGGLSGLLVAVIIGLVFNIPDDSGYIGAIIGGTCTLIGSAIGQYLDIIKEFEDMNRHWR